ncbi:hypothetical protein OQA88_4062 [Cercophora sp. LCS_1]
MLPQTPTHYQILSLPSTLPVDADPAPLIKRAYRLALLSHHPDKQNGSTPVYTIDQISLAYAVLSNPLTRQAYDKSLVTNSLPSNFQTGIEVVDLDDLAHDSNKGEWYRSCRCGNEKGYRFGEDDLEEAVDLGELMVGCVDCSLWLRVLFAVVEEQEEEAEANAAVDNDKGGR